MMRNDRVVELVTLSGLCLELSFNTYQQTNLSRYNRVYSYKYRLTAV